MPADRTTVFLHRPPGETASVVGGGDARVAQAERAVLQTAHGRVLVKSVKCGADGTFTGEIYAVMPREPEVSIGDPAYFGESNVFAFKVAEGAGVPAAPGVTATIAKPGAQVDLPAAEDDEIAQMTRTFEASFRLSDAAAPKQEARASAAPASAEASLFDMDIAAVLQDLPAPASAPMHVQPPSSQPAAKAPKAQEKDAVLSTAEAVSILRAAEHKGSAARNATADGAPAQTPPAASSVIERPRPPVTAPPPAPTAQADKSMAQPGRTDMARAPKPLGESVASPPPPAAKSVVAAPGRPVDTAVAPPRRMFDSNASETPATPAVKVPEAARVIAQGPAAGLQEKAGTPKPAVPIAPPGPEARMTCRECGSPLSIPTATGDESLEDYSKVSCRSCGRINAVKGVKP